MSRRQSTAIAGKIGSKNKENTSSRPSTATITGAQLDEIRNKLVKQPNQANAVTISENDLKRIRASTAIVTKREKTEMKKIGDEQKAQAMAPSNARRARMAANDMTRASKVPPNENDVVQQAKASNLLSKAQMQMDEELDDVKQMNQMVLYSKVVTIRDKQLEENQRLEGEWSKEQTKLDLMMEIERLKSLKHQEETQQRHKVAVKNGSLVIIDQIKDREVARQREQEALEKEKVQMRAHIQKMKDEDVTTQLKKKERVKIMMEEVGVANKQSIQAKEQAKEREKQAEQEIIDYNKRKAAREEEKAAEDRRVREEKEREVQRLRDLQEKAADRQSEIDELRAKRAFEEAERNVREAERQAVLKREKVKAEMEEARNKQFRENDARLAEQARNERDEFLRVIAKQKEEEENEKRLAQEKVEALKTHQKTLQTQIEKNGDICKQQRLDYLEEGRKTREKISNERVKIGQIKDHKLAQIQGHGISEKYQAELQKKKISF